MTHYSSSAVGWAAIATGIVGLLALVCLLVFFAGVRPFGPLNDLAIGLAALLSGLLAWLLYPEFHARSPLLSQLALISALAGAVVVVAGSVLVISGRTGWFLAGLYMAAGNGLIGLWLLASSYSARSGPAWPQSLVVSGLAVGLILALGLATIPGIVRGLDAGAAAPWYVNYIGQAGALGYLLAYPLWCIWLGRTLLLK